MKKKLNWEMVENIRHDYALGLNISDLSKKYEINRCTISDVVNQKSWNENPKSKQYEAFGELKTISEWLKDIRCVVGEATLDHRIRIKKIPLEIALTTPSDKGKRWKKSDDGDNYIKSGYNRKEDYNDKQFQVDIKKASKSLDIMVEQALEDESEGETLKFP
jgi:hypothetical protein